MPLYKIVQILGRFQIDYRLKDQRIEAADDFVLHGEEFREWVDVTDWKQSHLLAWLGY